MMYQEICPFCKRDPFHYVDIGVGMQAVAVNCCDLGADLYSENEKTARRARRVLRWMRSHSPRKKAKAWKALQEAGLRP